MLFITTSGYGRYGRARTNSFACGYVRIVYTRMPPARFQQNLKHFHLSPLHGDKCDCTWWVCHSSNKYSIITMLVQHLPCESKPSTKKGMSVPIKTPVRIEKEFTLSIQFLQIWQFMRKSQDCHVTLDLEDSYTECSDKSMVWVTWERKNT